MSFWLWVLVITSDGTTSFDHEFSDYETCLKSMVIVEEEKAKELKPPFAMILKCEPYPIPQSPPNPSIRT